MNLKSRKPVRKLGLVGRQQLSSVDCEQKRNLSDEDLESQFNAISLSIRTEALTLHSRLQHQRRQRDVCEESLKKEIKVLLTLIQGLQHDVVQLLSSHHNNNNNNNKSNNSGVSELYGKFSAAVAQVEVVGSSAMRITNAAENLGAVEHESRLSDAVDLLIVYVDNVRRKWEKEHRELLETKRILQESGLNVEECFTLITSSSQSRDWNSSCRRRASVPAALSRKISLLAPTSKVPHNLSIMEECKEETKLLAEESSAVNYLSTNGGFLSLGVVESGRKATGQGTAAIEQTSVSSEKVNKTRNTKRRTSKTKKWSQNRKDETNTFRKPEFIFVKCYLLMIIKNIWQRSIAFCPRPSFRTQTKWWTTGDSKWAANHPLDCIRYTAAVILILAAIFSLIITFIPSSSKVNR